jgi:hypothetical protein
MNHNPATIETLRKFCDGTELGPFEFDELKAAGFIAQGTGAIGKSFFVTATGHVALQAQPQLPLGEDMTQGPDDDSYLPPPSGMQMLLRAGRTFGDALDKQEGGAHYKDHAIQPIEYIHANKLGFIEGNVVKYITRHASKGGAEDVRKVIHYCELLLQLQYGEKA